MQEMAVGAPDWYQQSISARFLHLFKSPTFKFQDDSIVREAEPGIMKSGCYLTIILNTVAQVALHCMASRRCGVPVSVQNFVALGDDSLQKDLAPDFKQSYLDALESLGPKVKIESVEDGFSFVGFHFRSTGVEPAYRLKHLFKLEHALYLGEVLEAMQYMYSFSLSWHDFYAKLALKYCPGRYVPRVKALALWD